MSCLPENLERKDHVRTGWWYQSISGGHAKRFESLRWCRDLTHNQIYSPVTNLRASLMSAQHMGVSLNGGTPKTPQNDHF